MYFQISHDGGKDIKVIFATSMYEAIGFYLVEEVNDIGSESLDGAEVLPPEHKVEMSSIGFPTYKTLKEIHEEKEDNSSPQTIISLEYV